MATFAAPNNAYAKDATNTLSIVHNAIGNCHEAITNVPGSPVGTAFRVTVNYSCN